MTEVIIDISEFLVSPIRTGIQRVVRELVSNWPSSIPTIFARYDPGADALVGVPRSVVDLALEISAAGVLTDADVSAWIREALAEAPHAPIVIGSRQVLVPELFYDKRRIDFYHARLRGDGPAPHFIVYDFIPWLKPQTIGVRDSGYLMPYLQLLKRAERLIFISEAVRQEYIHRIMRGALDESAVGPAIPLGADGLKLPRQPYDPERRTLVCLGAFDGRKHQEIVLEAFLGLPEDRRGRLVFLGRVPDKPLARLRPLLDYRGPDVDLIDHPSDARIGEAMSQALATLFISTTEGFGLPALESLDAGVPVVLHRDLPAVADITDAGQIRLDVVDAVSVTHALETLLDPVEAQRLWDAAASVRPQSWARYAARVAEWVSGAPPPAAGVGAAENGSGSRPWSRIIRR